MRDECLFVLSHTNAETILENNLKISNSGKCLEKNLDILCYKIFDTFITLATCYDEFEYLVTHI